MTTVRKLWIGIGVLVLLSPLGIIIPALFHSGGAWGEWGLNEIEKLVGFVPQGMKQIGKAWKAPLPDYTVPGQGGGLLGESLGYIATAIVGIAVTAGIMYLLTRVLGRRKNAGPGERKGPR